MVLRRMRRLAAMCKALEEHAESAAREARPAVAIGALVAAGVPAVRVADSVGSAGEADARSAAPAERSDERSARAAESAARPVAKSDYSIHHPVQTDCHTMFEVVVLEVRSLLGQKANANPVPSRIGSGMVVVMRSRKAVRFHTC